MTDQPINDPIPQELKEFLDKELFIDAWKELPYDWNHWTDTELKRLPITALIIKYRKQKG